MDDSLLGREPALEIVDESKPCAAGGVQIVVGRGDDLRPLHLFHTPFSRAKAAAGSPETAKGSTRCQGRASARLQTQMGRSGQGASSSLIADGGFLLRGGIES